MIVKFDSNLFDVLLWQYNDATKLQQIIRDMQEFYDTNVKEHYEDWFKNFLNVDTADEFGLDLWGRILNINFAIEPSNRKANKIFAFGLRRNFYQSNFGINSVQDKKLSLYQKRLVIKLTYLKRYVKPTIPQIKAFLRAVVDKDATLNDNFNMTAGLISFSSEISQDLKDVIIKYDLLPRPIGTSFYSRVYTGKQFGFGNYNINFYKAIFGNNSISSI